MVVSRKLRIVSASLALLALLLSISAVMMNHSIASGYSNRIYDINEVPACEVGLVLGALVWNSGQPSDILEDRLLTAIELYRLGKVKKLLISGDHGTKQYDEVNVMKAFMLKCGVKCEDIFMDHAGFRTYDSCYRARDVFGVRSMVVITNEFHLPRALYIANKMGIGAVGVKSDRRRYLSANYNNAREFLACCKAYLDVNIIKPLPKYLGVRIDIHGNGEVTQD
ncbi:MAG: YdcF family protein [Planctomycetes bacterium]|nr:YdcF family protein [Planctomycetota bacterium]